MAKLGSYFGLCPLIDQQNLLGLSEDNTKGHIIATLGRNIAVKYRVSDQKQIQSWRSKDKFSALVIYDGSEGKYVGVFNQTNLKLWCEEEEQLDKLKKYKFNKPIYTLLNINTRTFVVFKDGNIQPLKKALEIRKDIQLNNLFDEKEEELQDVIHIEVNEKIYFGIITQNNDSTNIYLCVLLGDKDVQFVSKIELNRKDAKLSGYVFCQMYNKHVHFLSLWSDEKLYSYKISGNQHEEENAESFGSVYATIQSVSSEQFVAMTAISSDQIALYGAKSSKEGASLIIYNTQFRIVQSEQSFKLFAKAKKMWCMENYLFICTGQNLAAVPYHINTEQLSAIIGSHKINPAETDVQQSIITQKWNDDDNTEESSNKIPPKIKEKVNELLLQGLSEGQICDYLIPLYIESNDLDAIKMCLEYFNDVPEKALITLLVHFTKRQLEDECDLKSINCQLIDIVLSRKISDVLLFPHLKHSLDVESTLYLIKYICYLLSLDGHNLPELSTIETEQKLVAWSCLILDANYQRFLLSRDEKVLEILAYFKNIIKKCIDCTKDLKALAPLCENVLKGKALVSVKHADSFKYCIREINF